MHVRSNNEGHKYVMNGTNLESTEMQKGVGPRMPNDQNDERPESDFELLCRMAMNLNAEK